MSGIYEAFEPIETAHTPAPPPPTVGFGLEALKAGWTAGQNQNDWGRNQLRQEDDIREAFRDALSKRGVEPPPLYQINLARSAFGVDGAASANVPGWVRRAAEDDAAFWRHVAEQRRADPKFMSEYADIVDSRTLANSVIARRKQRELAAGDTYAEATTAGRAAWWLGNLGTGFTDPVSYIPVGGGVSRGASVAGKIFGTAAREAAINAGVTLAIEPLTQQDARLLGKKRDLSDILTDVGASAVVGGLLGGAEAGLSVALSRRGSAQAALDETVKAIGPENLTPDERAAVNVVQREIDIREASPFAPTPAGDREHGTRLAAAMSLLDADQPVGDVSVRARLSSSTSNIAMLSPEMTASKIILNESGGKASAKAATSSASGLGQFIDSTWLGMARKYPEYFPDGATREQILALKTDPALGRKMTELAVRDYAVELNKAGLPASEANIYVSHFVGPGKAIKMLREHPDTPIARVLSEREISANERLLRGKTVGDVVAWADKKMGGAGERLVTDAPVLRRDLFATDEDFVAAQRSFDGVDDYVPNLQDSAVDIQRIESQPVSDIDPVAQAGIVARIREFAGRFIGDRSGRMEPIDIAPVTPRQAQLVREAVGVDVDGFEHSIDSGAIRHWWERHGPEGNRIPPDGRPMTVDDLDRIPEILASPDSVTLGRGATVKGRSPTVRFEKKIGDEFFYVEEVRGKSKKLAMKSFYVRTAGDEGSPRGGGAEASPRSSETLADTANIGPSSPNRNVADAPGTTPNDVIPDQVVREAEAESSAFSETDGADAQAQVDSVAHDLAAATIAETEGERIALEASDGTALYRIDEDGSEIDLGSILQEIEADEAAIQAARNCL